MPGLNEPENCKAFADGNVIYLGVDFEEENRLIQGTYIIKLIRDGSYCVKSIAKTLRGDYKLKETGYENVSFGTEDVLSEEEFCKYAKLSPQNRAKLADYWVNMLGYPKDYVSLMTKDYEK